MQIKFFKKEKKFRKESSGFSPSLCWELAVGIMLVTSLFFIFFGYRLFTRVNQEPVLPVNNINELETVKKERIEKILEYFSLRKQKSNQILNSPTSIIDPSL